MPAPRDLTGQRFGALTVLRSDGRVFWGQDQTAWLCRCDCGAEIRVPQRRLTTSQPSHQIRACEDCRSTPCEICGKPVARATNARTCSPECLTEKHRRYQLAYYHDVRAPDPEDTAKRRARGRDRWAAMTPEEKPELASAVRDGRILSPNEQIIAAARVQGSARKSKLVEVRLSAESYNHASDLASQAGMRVEDYLRRIILRSLDDEDPGRA